MNNITVSEHKNDIQSLEWILAEISKWGKPQLIALSNGWHCSLDMLVSGAGVSFKVASEYDHETPTLAAQQCYLRMKEAINSLAR